MINKLNKYYTIIYDVYLMKVAKGSDYIYLVIFKTLSKALHLFKGEVIHFIYPKTKDLKTTLKVTITTIMASIPLKFITT